MNMIFLYFIDKYTSRKRTTKVPNMKFCLVRNIIHYKYYYKLLKPDYIWSNFNNFFKVQDGYDRIIYSIYLFWVFFQGQQRAFCTFFLSRRNSKDSSTYSVCSRHFGVYEKFRKYGGTQKSNDFNFTKLNEDRFFWGDHFSLFLRKDFHLFM